MTIRVLSTLGSGNQDWKVKRDGDGVLSRHRLKRRAREEARKKADDGERITIYDGENQFQESFIRQRNRGG